MSALSHDHPYRKSLRAEMARLRDELERCREVNAELLAALAEYVVLGHGKCTISKAHAEKAAAAIAKARGEVQP
jgi:hypothetical protein